MEMKQLFLKYMRNETTQQELEELFRYFGSPENREQLDALIYRELCKEDIYESAALTELFTTLDDKVLRQIKSQGIVHDMESSPRAQNYRIWKRIAIAAALLIVLATGIALFLRKENTHPPSEEFTQLSDIPPGYNRAILTVGSGTPLELDSTKTGIQIEDGQVQYNDGTVIETSSKTRQYAVLSTPNGGNYTITLPDGTTVWLNAASTLRYPLAFTGDSREVVLDGEAYFEVHKNHKQPFIVVSHGQQVTVLGTTFNINAYLDEGEIATTLVEGAVEVTKQGADGPQRLYPGQQAVFKNNKFDIKPVDVEYYTNWRTGKFTFDRVKLSIVLRHIERWYDVEFVGSSTIGDIPFWGSLSREVMLSELLDVLTLNTGLTFKREGRKIMMKP